MATLTTILLSLFCFAFLLVSPPLAGAQPSPSKNDSLGGGYTVKVNPAVAAIVMSFILVFFFLGFFSVYFRRCGSRSLPSGRVGANAGDGNDGIAGRRGGQRGLDREVLETFPSMAYAKAKELKSGEEALECAVCLSEFSDEDVLRLLPKCNHVFHVDCIDVWLDSHVTCPVCRCNLADPGAAAAPGVEEIPADGTGEQNSAEEGNGDLETGRATRSTAMRRWNSTGHEASESAALADRFTLRLPEHVRREILAAGRYRRASSLTVVPDVGDASLRRSSRGGLGGLSGRWRSLWRTVSMRRSADAGSQPAGAEGSSKRIFPAVDEAPLQIRVDGVGADGNGSGSYTKDSSAMTPSIEKV